MTLFNALILSRFDYCSQLWLPHLIRHIIQIEKVQRSFTKFITGMHDCSYSDRLSLLRLYHSLLYTQAPKLTHTHIEYPAE